MFFDGHKLVLPASSSKTTQSVIYDDSSLSRLSLFALCW